jgi:hypothetical protein
MCRFAGAVGVMTSVVLYFLKSRNFSDPFLRGIVNYTKPIRRILTSSIANFVSYTCLKIFMWSINISNSIS